MTVEKLFIEFERLKRAECLQAIHTTERHFVAYSTVDELVIKARNCTLEIQTNALRSYRK